MLEWMILWYFDPIRPEWKQKLPEGWRVLWGGQQKGRDMVILSQKLFKTIWSGYWVDFLLITPCVSPLTNSVTFWILRKEMGQWVAKGQNLNTHNCGMHPGKFMEMKC